MSQLPIKKCRIIIVMIASLGAMSVGCAFPPRFENSKKPPPTMQQVANVWTGMSDDDTHYCRLALNVDGSGVLSILFLEEKVHHIPFRRWVLKGRTIEFELNTKPCQSIEVTSLTGHYFGSRLDLCMRSDGWVEYATLWRKTDIDARNRRLEESVFKSTL